MRIGRTRISHDRPPYIIAEIGVNHNGDPDRAVELVERAHAAGADAVKFQFFETDRLLSRSARLARYQSDHGVDNPFDLLRSLELPITALREAAACARSLKIDPILTVFSVELVEIAESADFSAYKTASPDIINRPLIDALRSTGRPLVLSTGAATMPEVSRAVEWLRGHPATLLQCVSAYPTPPEHAALGGIAALATLGHCPVGYSDHTTSVETGGRAVEAGAVMLEKHLTFDCSASGPDHAASLDPEQFAEYVRLARERWGQGDFRVFQPVEKRVLPIEEDVREVARQSIVTCRPVRTGELITRDHLTIKRPGGGMEPWMIDQIIGRRLIRDLEGDVPITLHDIEPTDAEHSQARDTVICA